MIPFPFNENEFSFLVADHLLVGQLCTNPKSDRSLLSCLKVTQCSTSAIGDAPLYNLCPLPIKVMTTGPLPAPSKCKSGRFNAWGHSSTQRTTLRTATVMVFGVVSSEGHIMPPHIFDLKVNTKVYLDVLKSVMIPWCNQVAGGRPWVWQQDSLPAHNCCCSCSFGPEIIEIGQSSHKMYSNNILNIQESTTILNACTKKSGNLLNAPRICIT